VQIKDLEGDSGTIHSIAIQLSPTQLGLVRATVGHQAHAAFLRAVREADPALADVLHHPVLNQRPFSVSPLMGVDPAREGQVAVRPEETYTLRFTILLKPIFQQFMNRFLRGDRPVLRLGRVLFLIKEILATPEGSPWAGYTSFGQLMAGAETEPRISFKFWSPTAFSFGQRSWGRQVHVLPDARLVFSSLAKTWAAFAPPSLWLDPKAVESYTDENVVVQRLDGLETRMLNFGRYPQVGFVGRVTYQVMDGSEEAARWRRTLNALAGFAFYAGVGYKRTMGMGQCRRVDGGGGKVDDG
jgi:CRISPR-associated endoribonuclease Cas6